MEIITRDYVEGGQNPPSPGAYMVKDDYFMDTVRILKLSYKACVLHDVFYCLQNIFEIRLWFRVRFLH